jgi:hypothetical protein
MPVYPVPGSRAWGALLGVWIIASFAPAAFAGDDEALSPPTGALPGLWRVGTATAHAPGFALVAASGYGYTESVLNRDDAHHRTGAGVALSYRPSDWLAIAAGFDGRYDRHVGEGVEDRGYIGEPRLTARAIRLAPKDLTFGAQATLWLPGDRAPSIIPAAASLDVVGLVTYAPPTWTRHALHASGGIRVDRSAASAPDANRLSLAQRLALGVSESDALLFGAGWTARLPRATLFAEWSWDLLVGENAPAPLRSPMRLAGGVHLRAGERYQVFGLTELAVSGRPGVSRDDPLVPVEPRASFFAGLSYRFGHRAEDHAGMPQALPGVIAGRVVTADDQPLPGARVRVVSGTADVELETGEDGAFRAGEIPPGRVGIIAHAEGYRERSVAAELAPSGEQAVVISLERDLPDGQLKGLVLSFDGSPIRATIRIDPLGIRTAAGSDGTFEVDLPPGEYEVAISARGHRNQVRVVTVEEHGVTVLNIDMRRER